MNDPVFSGPDVPSALASAGASLGLAVGDLRYVVLDDGGEGRAARVAILIGGRREAADRPPASVPVAGPREVLSDVLGALNRAGDLDLSWEITEAEGSLRLALAGPGAAVLAEDEGEALEALDYLLQRMLGRQEGAPRLKLSCEGYRERRDEALAAEARRLAAEVRRDGRVRETRPLNSYERRIVHMTIGEEPGLRSYGVGEGRERRVAVAPVLPEDDPPLA